MFLFQAEDGIRDLVRSRGLGDVYKRQVLGDIIDVVSSFSVASAYRGRFTQRLVRQSTGEPVSYTHLTLPTSDLG